MKQFKSNGVELTVFPKNDVIKHQSVHIVVNKINISISFIGEFGFFNIENDGDFLKPFMLFDNYQQYVIVDGQKSSIKGGATYEQVNAYRANHE